MIRRILLVAVATAFAAGCETIPMDLPKARAELQPTKGSAVRGFVNFEQRGDRVRVIASVSGLKPRGQYGFHIHEAGDCSSGDGMSTKGHFNPHGKPHAHHSVTDRHAGDLPQLESDANGNATLMVDLDIITITPGPASIIGRGLIVHVAPDDYKTQPTGNAGARSACAVIQRS